MGTVMALNSRSKKPEYKEVTITVDVVEVSSVLRWNLVEDFDGAIGVLLLLHSYILAFTNPSDQNQNQHIYSLDNANKRKTSSYGD